MSPMVPINLQWIEDRAIPSYGKPGSIEQYQIAIRDAQSDHEVGRVSSVHIRHRQRISVGLGQEYLKCIG